MKLKDLMSLRIIIWILALLVSILAINPSFSKEGVAIKDIASNSSLIEVGLKAPQDNIQPRSYEILLSINDNKINDLADYQNAINSLKDGDLTIITTNKKTYDPVIYSKNFGLSVINAPKNNLRKGLDLVGGTRVVLKPTEPATKDEIETTRQNLDLRLNVYGLQDIDVRKASDLEGNQFIIVEVAGASQEEVRRLVGKQGKFEAKIGNQTVFLGGEKDITFVCRNDGTCSGIRNCDNNDGNYLCQFEFVIQLSEKAAKRHAEITKEIPINNSLQGRYLQDPLQLFLDDKLVETLLIDASLQGIETSSILISGPGFGSDESSAIQNALLEMNELQTVMITGSLPVKLEIVKIDTISPTLGNQFVKNAFLSGLFAILAVFVVIFMRYRVLKIALSIMIAVLSELIIILGISALFRNNIDLAGIAGMIAAIGTGVDDQIVILDEVTKGGISQYNWKEKVGKAFFVIFIAFFATVAAMLPLLYAGVGLLKGFAIVTIAGISAGVFITRPAFAKIVQYLIK